MQRFEITYRLFAGSDDDALEFANAIALENTVEIPRDVVPKGYIEDVVLGRVQKIEPETVQTWQATIGYHIDAAGEELPQLLNVIFGNASILKGVKVIKMSFNDDVRSLFPGARFGSEGVRNLTGKSSGGFICPVIKPQGSSIEELAELCYQTALAGADIVKEDHGLSNQTNAPFKERVPKCAEAVAKANAIRKANGDDSQAIYLPNIGGHGDQVEELAFFAKAHGATGLLLIPGLFGFDAMQRLARNENFGLPVMAHPSFTGPYVLSENTGYSHGCFFGDLMRLSGADISVFPNYGGRFGFSKNECMEIVDACNADTGIGNKILPSPGGGMSLERLPEMHDIYGDDCVYLVGGSLLRFRDKIKVAIEQMRTALA
ncbi:RuBisCO large subunit C-terminal-like domain-containing protein [Lentilitoribacter sp. Alg239-R112]|uniref:RuBisCO large subunit C-terminal-like domain-containing protein n=1 Tax=Lentilitoribacter sp. Alg239-R112 TaxID=2305987 RepID=UPI0013A6A3A0|nr:RuBisCO large subunit C-terminal-like domain-containing protein [Lentilitoribacter sp. Alg239-R112]